MREIINQFDNDHIIKQVILIGEDGAIKNIELNNEVEDD